MNILQINMIFFMSLIATTLGCSLNATNSTIQLESWMKNLPQELKDMPLSYIAIPGSHDSMTYSISGTSEIGPDAEVALRFAAVNVVGGYVTAQWAKTQKFNTKNQLNAGIRFLDLRIATKDSTSDFYYTHGLYAGEISTSLNEIKEFVDTHPEEVVILYFQHFYGFTNENHTRLIKTLEDFFLLRLVPPPISIADVTINNLAKLNQSIIIIYNNGAVQRSSKLWYPDMLLSPWPQKQTTAELLDYFRRTVRPREIFFVHQAVLTPSGDFIALRIWSSLLAACAEPVLKEVLPVIASDFSPGRVKKSITPLINVVIADFIDLEDNLFPRTIIGMNKKLVENK